MAIKQTGGFNQASVGITGGTINGLAVGAFTNERRLLGTIRSANMNVTTDQAITISSSSKFMIDSILVTNTSISLTTAAGGIYTAASKGGTAIVAAAQIYSALTAATVVLPLTLALTNTTLAGATIYFSLTTGQGVAATADIYVFGYDLT